ncbi:MAG TPA: hypothetical protein VHE81_09560 [Lacipirellulaceae bacterium]|nr:hypothetical protein [Lacipirellulaceae bacterium]
MTPLDRVQRFGRVDFATRSVKDKIEAFLAVELVDDRHKPGHLAVVNLEVRSSKAGLLQPTRVERDDVSAGQGMEGS